MEIIKRTDLVKKKEKVFVKAPARTLSVYVQFQNYQSTFSQPNVFLKMRRSILQLKSNIDYIFRIVSVSSTIVDKNNNLPASPQTLKQILDDFHAQSFGFLSTISNIDQVKNNILDIVDPTLFSSSGVNPITDSKTNLIINQLDRISNSQSHVIQNDIILNTAGGDHVIANFIFPVIQQTSTNYGVNSQWFSLKDSTFAYGLELATRGFNGFLIPNITSKNLESLTEISANGNFNIGYDPFNLYYGISAPPPVLDMEIELFTNFVLEVYEGVI